MKILAADTALGACSVAVLDGAHMRAHRFETMERGHAEALAPMVEDAMRQSGIAFADIERLAVTTGPGSFTGQRVGLAFMRGLRVALKKPLVGVTTLEAMCAAALNEAKTDYAAAIHDARRGEAYLAITSETEVLLPPTLVTLDAAASKISGSVPQASVALAGTAAQLIADGLGARAIVTSIGQPDALWVARLAAVAPEPAEAPHPLYLRAPDAKLPA
ncbi:MAG: tRNA (adenosine(37)-N6)-threonylcarbamoyltransferase complex dimerization subunit type 1 TsaB [Proteobacteria bacterium]|nr:tRNA (adenosine(37)-N6)-threonylcarbamoyltransferase complex dimerization subunit type 1 TsaB [Pseudomonadota bacterium]